MYFFVCFTNPIWFFFSYADSESEVVKEKALTFPLKQISVNGQVESKKVIYCPKQYVMATTGQCKQ